MGGGNSSIENQEEQEVDTGKKCDGNEHAFKTIFKCDKQNCESFLCRKCMGF